MTYLFEDVQRRQAQTADLPAALTEMSDAEIDVLQRHATGQAGTRYAGTARFGREVLVLIDAELARRDQDKVWTDATFWAQVADFHEPAEDDLTGLPKWSEISGG